MRNKALSPPQEFPKLQAGSLRSGFAVIFEGKIRTIKSVDKRISTIQLTFTDSYQSTILNETILEVVATKTERKGKHGKRNARTRSSSRK